MSRHEFGFNVSSSDTLSSLQWRVTHCRKCPRLVKFREHVSTVKRRSYVGFEYWGRPVRSFGDPKATVLIIGLAPAAHGGNRTGRMFTGDASARFLMDALYRFGFANQPTSESWDDDLALHGLYITGAARCAPPGDRPSREELSNCEPYLLDELSMLTQLRVVLALGQIAFDAYLRLVSKVIGMPMRLPFKHGARYFIGDGFPILYVSYHPSPRNHQTGRLTKSSLAEVISRVKREAGQ